jgi:AcrR family transcriptional regulator
VARKAGSTKEETKGRLIDAAARIFADNGYEGTRVSEIARTAGLTTGAIYAHYENKAELLCEAIRSYGTDALSELLASERGVSLPDALETVGRIIPYEEMAEESLLVEAILASRRDPEVASFLSGEILRREGFMARLVRAAQNTGDVDEALPADAIARLVTQIALGSLVIKALDLVPPAQKDWSVVIHRLVELLEPEESHGN